MARKNKKDYWIIRVTSNDMQVSYIQDLGIHELFDHIRTLMILRDNKAIHNFEWIKRCTYRDWVDGR